MEAIVSERSDINMEGSKSNQPGNLDSSAVVCQPSCFESCIDLSGSLEQFEDFEIVKSHEFGDWEHSITHSHSDGSTELSNQSDLLALTMSSVAESLWSSIKLSDTDFEVIEMDYFDTESTLASTSAIGNLCSTILDRALRERERELSELQNASCVTTGDARTNLSQFFNRYNQASPPDDNASNQQVPSNQQETALPPDVQSLMQRSIVTSALNRGSFRDILEQTLGARRPASPPVQRQPPNRPNGIGRPRSARIRNTGSQQQTPPSLRASLLAEIRNRQPQQPRSLPANINFRPPAIPRANVSNQSNSAPAAPRLQVPRPSVPNHPLSALQQQLQRGVAMLSETINQDLRQLHQYSVVTSVLNGEFRAELEELAQRHVEQVGNGPEVSEFIRSIAMRQPAAAAGGANVQRSQSMDGEVYSELRNLKVQMNEMRRIMQMNVEVQLDVQRAVRQEVAAIMGAVRQHIAAQLSSAMQEQVGNSNGSSLPGTLSHVGRHAEQNHSTVDAGACAICLDRRVDAVFYQCGHMCVCIQCGLQLKADGHSCPVCRATIHDVIRAYQSQMDV